jgi:hypothetical protein
MFEFPDRSRRLPPIDRVAVCRLLGHDRWQLVQVDKTKAVFRLEGPHPSGQVANTITELMLAALGDDFVVEMESEADISASSSGKRHHVVNGMALAGMSASGTGGR